MIRLVGPTDDVVPLDDLKEHLRVSHDDEDLLIQGLADAATSWLDGWGGVLGRCIMPQTWRIAPEDLAAGFRLPDASTVVVNADGSIDATCAMPAGNLPAVQMAIKLLVGHWYMNREAVGGQLAEQPMAVRMLLEPLRNA